jgi:ABC-type branched-subunit amino acid transport system substrate-binding protein
MTGAASCSAVIFADWFLKTYPDKNNVVLAFPDEAMGHMMGGMQSQIMSSIGMKLQQMYYPPAQTDLSSLGTKIKSINPAAVMVVEVPTIKAIRDAGYTGLIMCAQPYAIDDLLAQSTPEALEGYIGEAMPTEFDPTLTQAAQDFKNAYIAKYGKWDNMDMNGTIYYQALLTAIQKAGSVDVDKVAAVLSNGMAWTSPAGEQKMVSRPDLGNSRTVDSVTSFYIKQIQGGKSKLIATVSLADAEKIYTDALANMPPMSGPPPGQ